MLLFHLDHFVIIFHLLYFFIGFTFKEAKILFLGLDNAGKTTLLNMLKTGNVGLFHPTLNPNSEELIIGKIKFKTFDLGGHETAQRLWRDYYQVGVDGVVFIVDANDRSRFPEASKALNQLLTSEELKNVPFLILGNKIDMPNAASEDDLRICLGLTETYGKELTLRDDRTRPIELYMCSILRKVGYSDGFQWLSRMIG